MLVTVSVLVDHALPSTVIREGWKRPAPKQIGTFVVSSVHFFTFPINIFRLIPYLCSLKLVHLCPITQ